MSAVAFDFIYLSPHLDDAVFSCGGQIAARVRGGARVLIATVAAGDAPVKRLSNLALCLHRTWGLGADAVARRRSEDAAACAVLGAAHFHGAVPDAIYREDPVAGGWLYRTPADLYGTIHPAEEAALLSQVEALIRRLPPHGALVAPLGVGAHVDHRLVRRAAEAAAAGSLSCYEEYPYAAAPGAREAALGEPAGWIGERIELAAEARAKKSAAIGQYRSQAGALAPAGAAASTDVERTWRRRPPA